MKNDATEVLFCGFRDAAGVRQFAFDVVGVDHSRTRFVVVADMGLARKYNIRLQELPLLCRRLLNESQEQPRAQPISFTEEHMAAVRTVVEARDEKKRRKPVPVSADTGRAWR